MKREIVELDDLLLIEAEHVARQHNKTLSEVIAEALRPYIDANRKPIDYASIIGIIDVAMPETAEAIDRELMEGLDPVAGWSHDPPSGPASAAESERRAS